MVAFALNMQFDANRTISLSQEFFTLPGASPKKAHEPRLHRPWHRGRPIISCVRLVSSCIMKLGIRRPSRLFAGGLSQRSERMVDHSIASHATYTRKNREEPIRHLLQRCFCAPFLTKERPSSRFHAGRRAMTPTGSEARRRVNRST